MSHWGAKVWNTALTAYGKVPYHPGKWRVIKYLQAKAGPYTGALRLVRRNQVWYELDLRDYLPQLVFLNAFEAWALNRSPRRAPHSAYLIQRNRTCFA
jgi:hypothetical protein